MSFILKDNPVVVNIKLTNEGRKKLASGNFNVTKFAVGDSEMNYKYYNEINFNKNNSIVLSPKENIKDIKYKVKKFFNSQDLEYNITPLSSRRETKIDLNIGFFEGNSIYEMTANLNSALVKISKIRIDLGDINTDIDPRLLRIRQDSGFVFDKEPEVGEYILVNWSNFINNPDNFRNGIIDYDKYSPFIWYKIISVNGSLQNNTLSVEVDRDLPDFQIFQSNNFYSNCLIYPKYNSILDFYGTDKLSDFWNFTDNDYIENILENTLITPIFNLTLFYPEKNTGFLSNFKIPNILQSYQYAGFLEYISEYNKDKNLIYGIVHYTNTTPHNTIGESFYKNTAEILLPTIMWYKNKDNKLGLRLKCGDNIKRVTNHNLYYYDIIDETGFIVGKCFHELKIFLIEDQELLSALSFKSNRNWTLPPSNLTINDFVCPPDEEE
jgi:hypothetical protein